MSKKREPFQRPQAATLARRLGGPRRFLQVAAGSRQVGRSTLVQQVAEDLAAELRYASAVEPTLLGAECVAHASRPVAHGVAQDIQPGVG